MSAVSTFSLPSINSTKLLSNDDNFVSEISFEIDSNSASKSTISSLIGCTICEVSVYIVDTYNNDATISIGTDADISAVMSASDIDAQTSAQYCNDGLLYNVEKPLTITVSGSPTVGRALISFKLYRE